MSVPAGTISDGDFLYASLDVTFGTGGSAVVYFSKNIRLTDGSRKIEGQNSAGVTKRKAYVKNGYLSGSATLMYPTVEGAAYQPAGAAFSMTIPEIDADAKDYIVTSSTPSRTNDGEATLDIEFDEVLNTLTVGA